MDKETLSNYGWIVICVLILAIMIALATPFGSFISHAVQNTTQGLFDVNRNALNNTGLIYVQDQGFDGRYDHNAPELHPNDGSTPTEAETYKYGDYIYTYEEIKGGWAVQINTEVTDKKQTEYGPILESINGKPILSLQSTFANCTSLIKAPAIPQHVKNLVSTFEYCASLKNAPVISNSVTNMRYAFRECTSLTVAPDMKNANNVVELSGAFQKCPFKEAPTIPESVTLMQYTFANCESLIVAPKLPENVQKINGIFYMCENLKEAPVIPNSVTNVVWAFYNCKSLETAPIIPENATDVTYTFGGCTALKGVVTFKGNIETYENSFIGVDFNAQQLKLEGNQEIIDAIGTTGQNYCNVCDGTCLKNH